MAAGHVADVVESRPHGDCPGRRWRDGDEGFQGDLGHGDQGSARSDIRYPSRPPATACLHQGEEGKTSGGSGRAARGAHQRADHLVDPVREDQEPDDRLHLFAPEAGSSRDRLRYRLGYATAHARERGVRTPVRRRVPARIRSRAPVAPPTADSPQSLECAARRDTFAPRPDRSTHANRLAPENGEGCRAGCSNSRERGRSTCC